MLWILRLPSRAFPAILGLSLLSACSASPPARAAACNEPLTDLYQRVSPAVVAISAQFVNPYRLSDRVTRAIGSGFIFDGRGLVLTNSHVVFGAQVLSVQLDDNTNVPARLVGADPIYDIAVIQFAKPKTVELSVLHLGDSDQARPGEEVVAIGSPLGLDQTITRGIISAVNRVLPERPLALATPFIQTDAPINPGNSGGPLLNRCGEVVGINTAIAVSAQSIGFAVPSNMVREVMPQLLKHGRVIRPWVGFAGQFIGKDLVQLFTIPLKEGYLIEAVEPGSPAAAAGIRGGSALLSIGGREFLMGGDIIVEVNGLSTSDQEKLPRIADFLHVGETLKLKVFRDGEYLEKEIMLPERPLQPGDVPETGFLFSPAKAPRVQPDANHTSE